MRRTRVILRLAAALAVLASPVLLSAAPAAAAGGGWVRLAHFSPNTPAVDVYLYSFGDAHARLVLRHVSYGEASPYEPLPAGEYTVAMRAAGAKPSSKPVLSTAFSVAAGHAYTVAGMGPASGLRLQVLDDTLTVPAGRSLVRVIQASLRQHLVTVTLGGRSLAARLRFGSATGYTAVASGPCSVRAAGQSEQTRTGVSLAADTTHTLVVLDGAHGLRVMALADAAGTTTTPSGAAATGFGGMAPKPARSPLGWLVVTCAGLLMTSAGALRLRRAHAVGARRP